MTIRTIANQYYGINAHLHSHFQSEGGWDSFHTNHISDLMRLMCAQLLPMGYIADIEQSLQIRRAGDTMALTTPDIMTIDEELSPYRAVAIYQYRADRRGDPVAWIELLSPSNKPGGQDAGSYHDKRLKLLQSGLVFVELDYVHESPSTFDRLPAYAPMNKRSQPSDGGHPYNIVVVDPRPEWFGGKVYVHHFDVDNFIPSIDIPLNAGDIFTFDFGAAYNKTFKETLYGAEFVDYSQQPLNFDRYSRADQVRITHRMYTVLQAESEGKDLKPAPRSPSPTWVPTTRWDPSAGSQNKYGRPAGTSRPKSSNLLQLHSRLPSKPSRASAAAAATNPFRLCPFALSLYVLADS